MTETGVQGDRRSACAQTALALTPAQAGSVLMAAEDLGFPPGWTGAALSDMLGWLDEKEVYLLQIRAFTAAYGEQLAGDWFPRFAMLALLALGQRLTIEGVSDLVRRARTGERPYDPAYHLAVLVCWLQRTGGPFPTPAAEALGALKSAGVDGARVAEAEARIRALMEMTRLWTGHR
jgi:hypothetical protein